MYFTCIATTTATTTTTTLTTTTTTNMSMTNRTISMTTRATTTATTTATATTTTTATTPTTTMSITIYTARTISMTTRATTTATTMSKTNRTPTTTMSKTNRTPTPNMSMTNRTTMNTFFVMFSFRREKFFICVTISIHTFSCSYFASFFIITFIFIYFNTIIIKTSSKCISTPLSFHIISKQKVLPYSLLLVYLFLCKIIFLLVRHLSNELYILVEYYFFQFFQKLG